MMLFGKHISVADFVPPLVSRMIRFALKSNRKELAKPSIRRLPPFDSLPSGMGPRWLLDVGANVGDVTLAALRSFPLLKAVSMEPVSSTFLRLRKNLEIYEDRVHCINKALSDMNGPVDIHITSFDGANSLEPQTETHKILNPAVRELRRETIECIRLEDLAPGLPTTHFDIVKIDVEGHELKVLWGGAAFFESSVDFLILEMAMMRDPSVTDQNIFKIFSFLDKLGFFLVNLIDVHHVDRTDVMIAQFDCIFRNKRFLLGGLKPS